MARNTTVICFALFGSLAVGQMTDEQAIARARPYVARFAPEATNTTPQVYREVMAEAPGGPLEVIAVLFGEASVTLSSSGEFGSYWNLSATARSPRRDVPDKYASDNEAWSALEAVLVHFDVPSGLARKKLVRESGEGSLFAYRYTMHPQPYGYEEDGGNAVHATIHRITGRLLSVSIRRGWTYEPPNIQVTPEQAVTTVRLAHGGSVEDWQTSLRYWSVANRNAPEYTRNLRANRTMRLYYDVSSSRGNAIVDSVTGDIVQFFSPPAVGGTHVPKVGSPTNPPSGALDDKKALKQSPTQKTSLADSGLAAERADTEDNMGQAAIVAIGAVIICVGGTVLVRRTRLRG